jgi:hypothetical protein
MFFSSVRGKGSSSLPLLPDLSTERVQPVRCTRLADVTTANTR